MERDGAKFGAAMKINEKMESTGSELHSAMLDLAMELSQKPFESLTDVEKKFVKSFAMFSIFGLLSSKLGTN